MIFHRLVIAAFFVAAMAVVYFSLKTGVGEPLPIWDKAQHFIAYTTLAFLAGLAAPNARRAILYAVLLALMGYAIEWGQYYVGRDYDLKDELANSLGCVAGLVLSQLARRLVRTRDA